MTSQYPTQSIPGPGSLPQYQMQYGAQRPLGMVPQVPQGGTSVSGTPSVTVVRTPGLQTPLLHAKPPQVGNSAPSTSTTQQFKATEAAPAAKRTKKRKLPERNIPDKVAHIVPESAVFNKVCEYEKRINDLLQHKKAEIREGVAPPEHVKKKLRIYIYNTCSNQLSDPTQKSAEPPSWALLIHGRILEPAPAALTPAGSTAQSSQQTAKHGHPLSYYIRKLEVKFDSPLTPNPVVWERKKHQGPHKDSFEIRRKGNKAVNATIDITLDWQPSRYQLPKSLRDLLGLQYETRARVLHLLWVYIKSHNLMNPSQPQMVGLDDTLQGVFGESQIKLSSVSERLNKLLEPMPPITLQYTIRVDGASPTHPDCYDIEFEVPGATPANERLSNFLDKYSKDREIEGLDLKISTAIRKINEHRRRRAFYLGFSHSPVDFISALIASQVRDLRIAKNATGRDFELERRTEVFKEKWVEDAVMKYLHRKMSAGH